MRKTCRYEKVVVHLLHTNKVIHLKTNNMTTANTLSTLKIESLILESMVLLVETYVEGYEGITADKTSFVEFVKVFRYGFSIVRKRRNDSEESNKLFQKFRKIHIESVKYEFKMGYRTI